MVGLSVDAVGGTDMGQAAKTARQDDGDRRASGHSAGIECVRGSRLLKLVHVDDFRVWRALPWSGSLYPVVRCGVGNMPVGEQRRHKAPHNAAIAPAHAESESFCRLAGQAGTDGGQATEE